MWGEQQIQRLLNSALTISPADQTEVSFSVTNEALTRFANNAIHQNVAESDAALEVRAAFGKRVGTARTNDLSPDSVKRIVETACEAARHQPENEDFPGLPDPSPIQTVNAFDEAVASATPEVRAQAVAAICRAAQAAGANAAGAYSTTHTESAIANSRGLWAYHPGTSVDLTLVVAKDTGSGYAHGTHWRLDRVETERLGQEAVAKAVLAAQRPTQSLPTGEYTVILEPYAVADLLEQLAACGLGALAVQEGRSWMNGRLGKTIFSPQLSLWDDGYDLAGEPEPFDCEGVSKQRVDLIKAGQPVAPVYDTHTAAREPGRTSTGHAQPIDEDWDGPAPANMVMATGDARLEDLIASTPRGVYVTRFWYVNALAERNCLLTGTTRDGTFLIENGVLAAPVQNLRFTQSLLSAFKRITAVGNTARPIAGFYGSHQVPALKVDGFRFTA
jgi:predicted Zn-dependent protease